MRTQGAINVQVRITVTDAAMIMLMPDNVCLIAVITNLYIVLTSRVKQMIKYKRRDRRCSKKATLNFQGLQQIFYRLLEYKEIIHLFLRKG